MDKHGEIIEGCKRNERTYQELFHRMYYPRLMVVAVRMAPTIDIANDLLQDGFLKIFEKISTLDNHNPAVIYSWCKRVLTNTILDHYRRTKFERKNVFSSDDDNCQNQYHVGYNGGTSFFSRNEEDSYLESKKVTPEILMGALSTLTPRYKLVFNLYVMEGYTHVEIGEILEISVGTSKSTLSKAKAKIRKEIALCQAL